MGRDDPSVLGPASLPADQRAAVGMLLAGIAIIVLLTLDSVTQMVNTWTNTSAYNHCWLVLPIAGYLAWARRERMAGLRARPFWPGLIVVVGFAFAWLIARGGAIAEGEQIAVVGIVQGLLLTVLGRQICRAQILPILYLWLMVPTGGFLIPTLQSIATWQATELLALTSIPFFVEEYFIQLPVGLFFVAPGCAGLNFLLAALALSVVYADVMFRSWRRKLICILIALVVSVIANGMRIFGILVLAELSQRRFEIVDDHLLYGWGFFLVILLGLMWVGRFFADQEPVADTALHGHEAAAGGPASSEPARTSIGSPVIAAVMAIVMSGVIVGYARTVFAKGTVKTDLQFSMPATLGDWVLDGTPEPWEGAFPTADFTGMWRFRRQNEHINILIGYYWDQWDGHEAASTYNFARGPQTTQIIDRGDVAVRLKGGTYRATEEVARDRAQSLRIWHWYCAGGRVTSNAFLVRLLTALNQLTLSGGPAASFTLLTPDGLDAQERLHDFAAALSAERGTLEVTDNERQRKRDIACW